ncbi:hypothetical protein [Arcticibacter sp. MXS-1]|uniref:hypothetical protein n=1 Tax=Arcticibacter sp. MXS-1 TaxID=3341726 RepID=UPI0035A99815
METIFTFNPTDKELHHLFSYNCADNTLAGGFSIIPGPRDDYEAVKSEEEKVFDIAKLLEYRGDERAKEYWAKIPEIELEYRWGFDNLQIPVD